MKVFKFGGASVNDAEGVKNVVQVLQKVGFSDVLLVISAMGKMTNAFEKLVDSYYYKKESLPFLIDEIRAYHYEIAKDLFEDTDHQVFFEIEELFSEMTNFMIKNRSKNYEYIYDQIVSIAEFISTKIVSSYFNKVGIENTWINVKEFIKTNNDFRDAKVDWKLTEQNIRAKIIPQKLYITQGFLASDNENKTTTLGREGSDYSAGIFAYCLGAESLTIWKDVEGVLNADPRYFEETRLLQQISYTEAIELAFYGASVIHPKTLQPLQKKEIPLYVKSFKEPQNEGTKVDRGRKIKPETPCFIVKKDQILLSISSIDFSFIVERNISDIFDLLHKHKMKVNLIQNSAISFSVCMHDDFDKFENLIEELKVNFKIDFYKDVSLFTIRHFDENAIAKIENNNTILLKQISKETAQIVIQ